MAGDWIKFEKATCEKPEVYELAGILGIDPDAVIGKLLRVWSWFDTQSVDGNAHVTVCALLNRLVGESTFTDAMVEVGWLEVVDSNVKIPNFLRHNGKTAKNRALTASRVAKLRKCNADGNAVGNAKGNAKSNDLVTVDALAREEKRREDICTPVSPQGDKRKDPVLDEEFLRWWREYPKKVAKPKAAKAYRRVRSGKGAPAAEVLLAAVAKQKRSRQWLEGFVPNPTTWLNGERWTDEVAVGFAGREGKPPPPLDGEEGGCLTAAERAERLLASL